MQEQGGFLGSPIPSPSGGSPSPFGGPEVPGGNTSGMGPTAVVPPEVARGFNFGAFWFNWIWGIAHSAWIALIALPLGFFGGLIPFVGPLLSLGFCIYLGMKGNELAWRSRKFDSIEQFQAVQKAWTKWAIIFLVLLVVLVALMFPVMMRAMQQAQQAAQQSPPGGFTPPTTP